MKSAVITGGIACGKTVVGGFLADEGIPVCDADDLAHAAMAPGTETNRRIADRFGAGVLDAHGGIDRSLLGDIVFADGNSLADLNSIVHPEVKQRWQSWLEEGRDGEDGVAVVIVPLLFEAGLEDGWDSIIVVATSPDVQIERLKGRGLSEEKARQRINAQWDCRSKIPPADYVICNTGTKEQLKEQTARVLAHILEK